MPQKRDYKKELHCLEKDQRFHKIEVEVKKRPDLLEIIFNISSTLSPFITPSPRLAPSNWGLWNFDVVEVFLQPRVHDSVDSPYYEFQISPRSERFNLTIIKPRSIYYTPLNLYWNSSVKSHGTSWQASFSFKDEIFLKPNELYLGLHAILGEGNKRRHYAHYEYDDIIDFHRPKLFSRL